MRKIALGLFASLMLLALALPCFAETQHECAIFGLVPNMTSKDVESKLGKAQIERKRDNSWHYRIKGSYKAMDDPVVYFNDNNTVSWVMGSRLEKNGKLILRSGDGDKKLEEALGKADTVTEDKANKATIYTYKKYALTVVTCQMQIRVFAIGRDDAK